MKRITNKLNRYATAVGIGTLTACLLMAPNALGAEHGNHAKPEAHGSEHAPAASHGSSHSSLHFTRPIVSKSPQPTNEFHLEYKFLNNAENGHQDTHQLTAEVEYKFADWFSVEIATPYTWVDGKEGHADHEHLNTMDVGLKFANLDYQDQGLLLGGGIEFGVPTGSSKKHIGSDHELEFIPFVDFGYAKNSSELIGFAKFVLPTNRNGTDHFDWKFKWNLAYVYHLTDNVKLLAELDGDKIYGDHDEHEDSVVNFTPGVIFKPFEDMDNIEFGIGVGFPLTNTDHYDTRTTATMTYHF